MTNSRQKLGKWGEKRAASYLSNNGYEIVELNARTPYGEIDVVVRKNGVTIFVEVKTRRSSIYGYPEESITPKKIDHIINACKAYLAEHPELGQDWRIDVISIFRRKNSKTEIIHFENAISD
jgi:putative endonuclease